MSDDNCIDDRNIGGDLLKATAWVGRLGWIAFFVLLVFFMLYALIQNAKITPVLAVKDGEIVGEIVWYDRPRSDEEIVVDISRWAKAYFSQDSDTIFEEAALALSALSDELKQQKMDEWGSDEIQKIFGTNYLAYIRDLQQQTRIQFDASDQVKLNHLENGGYSARLNGVVIVSAELGGQPVTISFDTTVYFETETYTTNNTLGLNIYKMEDN